MTHFESYKRTFVALDTVDLSQALELVNVLRGHVGGVKIGKEFFTAFGPEGVRAITDCGMPIFLDLKFHDIPNTVSGAIKASLLFSPYMVNVHACGGETMMRAAMRSAEESGQDRPLVLGVTVLTSMDESDLRGIGVENSVSAQVFRLALLCQSSGLDGVVCSAQEVEGLRKHLGKNFKLVVPGIRPNWSKKNDQKRVVTPAEAIAIGADYLVIGRPITGAVDPVEAADNIAAEIDAGI